MPNCSYPAGRYVDCYEPTVLNADEGHCCFANGTCCVGYTQQGAPVALGCCPAEYRCVVTAGMAAGEHGCAKMDGTLNSIFVSILVVIVFFALVALSAMFLRARRRQRLRRMMEATYDDACKQLTLACHSFHTYVTWCPSSTPLSSFFSFPIFQACCPFSSHPMSRWVRN
uniref:Uncharacterized protein n=1 Tax=Palpitomonas bilix TaxID=652834 RepID=A0A7S3CW76_9EUKA|mmetsp:Transcript_11658/g.31355  ORF Transcript_11658/g.31355 Transcript_11658/m.31355 type:complete len:170 (+) Transcript_11658:227-736(+)